MPFVSFNSRDSLFKSVHGCLKTGQSVQFRIALPFGMPASGVRAVFESDDAPALVFPMERAFDNDYGAFWEFRHTFDEPGLHFYHFEFESSGETLRITRYDMGLGSFEQHGEPWQLTAYDKDYSTPSFLRGSVIYQIFPDRFRRGADHSELIEGCPFKDRVVHEDWKELPDWLPDKNGRYNSDYFGGTLEGIVEKLDHLVSLGVGMIYLNPVFEAHSNHRYDTADYSKIDPYLGNVDSLKKL
ncbi:MAG: glycoside hydrolase family 13 protein, partial [Clostridia bacterium]|nr:glycoside hydrolase family 13 protein [Clostridia bacterium]